MTLAICQACGVQFGNDTSLPDFCPLCRDERRHLVSDRSGWTALDRMRQDGFRNIISEIEAELFEIVTEPPFAAGQRAFLVLTEQGNVLWDCVSTLDAATVAVVKALGGIAAIAVSHPHFYGSMVAWSEAFDHVPIWLAAADRKWVVRPDDAIRYYRNEQEILPGIRAIRCGGHFPGSAVLHWAAGAEGKGALLVGDALELLPDRKGVSFMYSRPNRIPLPPARVRAMVELLRPLEFDRIYGGWPEENIGADGRQIFLTSADRYLRKMEGRDDPGWKAAIL